MTLLALADLMGLCCGWGFKVQASTLPELLATAWFQVGPFETEAQCRSINEGMRVAGTYREVKACEEW